MTHLLHLLMRLYPGWWRKRYGDEFKVFLDEARPGIYGILDILKGACAMQLSRPDNPLKILGITSVIGLIAVVIFGISMERPFRSTATVAMTHNPVSQNAIPLDESKNHELMTSLALSRTSLTKIADARGVYPHLPDNDRLKRIKEMIEIRWMPAFPDLQDGQSAFAVSFSHPDPRIANDVVRDLTSEFLQSNAVQVNQTAGEGSVFMFTVLSVANLPDTPVQPAWGKLLAIGLAGGIGLGLVLILLLRLMRGARVPPNDPPVPAER